MQKFAAHFFVMAVFWLAAGGLRAVPVPLVPADFESSRQPQLAVNADGTVYAVFGKANEVFVAVSRDDGHSFEAPLKVCTLSKYALGMRRGPRIVASDNTLIVTVVSGEGELLAFRSSDEGKTWAQPCRINSVPKSALEGLHGLAAGPAGKLYVTWLDLRTGQTEVYGAISADGGKSWDKDALVYRSPDGHVCECCAPSVAFNQSGDLAVMWRNSLKGNRDLWMAVRPHDQASFGDARKLGRATWKLSACPMDGGALIANCEGKFISVWRSGTNVYFCDAAGNEHNLGGGIQPMVAVSGSDDRVIWQQDGKLISAIGGNAGAQTLIDENAEYGSAVTSPKTGAVIVAYESTRGKKRMLMVETLAKR